MGLAMCIEGAHGSIHKRGNRFLCRSSVSPRRPSASSNASRELMPARSNTRHVVASRTARSASNIASHAATARGPFETAEAARPRAPSARRPPSTPSMKLGAGASQTEGRHNWLGLHNQSDRTRKPAQPHPTHHPHQLQKHIAPALVEIYNDHHRF